MAANNMSSAYRHPNPPQKWTISFCDAPFKDVCTSFLGLFLPCFLFGRTQYRLKRKAQGQDATDLTGYNPCNMECCAFWATYHCVHCGWICPLVQHIQVKNAYGISSDIITDCLQVFFCWPCTLVRDEHEVCARENLSNYCMEEGTIHHQPLQEPKMECTAAASIESSKAPSAHHHANLVKANVPVLMAAQVHGVSDNLSTCDEDASKVVNDYEHTFKLSRGKAEAAIGTETSNISKRKKGVYNLIPFTSASSIQKFPKPSMDDRDAIIVSRQPWRSQKVAGQAASSGAGFNRTYSQQHQRKLAHWQGDSLIHFENRDRKIMHFSSERSFSEPERLSKRQIVRRSFSSVASFGRESKRATGSENKLRRRTITGTSEAVIVYYSDGERPQRHRLADCTRTRASTPGHPETPHEHNPRDCLSEEIASGTAFQETSKTNVAVESAEIGRVKGSKNLAPQHALDDCIGSLENKLTAVQHSDVPYKLANCPGNNGTHTEFVIEITKNEDPKIFEHPLDVCCKADTVEEAAGSGFLKQHNTVDCVQTEPRVESGEPSGPEQHSLDGRISMDKAESSDIVDLEHPAASAMIHGYDSEPTMQAQNCNETVAMTVKAAQHPVIVVSSTGTAKSATLEKLMSRKSQCSKTAVTATDSKTVKEPSNAVADSARDKDQPPVSNKKHGGVNEWKIMPQLSQAAATSQKVSGGDGNEDDMIIKPAKAILPDDTAQIGLSTGGDRKQRRRGRSRASRGRGKGSKDVL